MIRRNISNLELKRMKFKLKFVFGTSSSAPRRLRLGLRLEKAQEGRCVVIESRRDRACASGRWAETIKDAGQTTVRKGARFPFAFCYAMWKLRGEGGSTKPHITITSCMRS